jgi:hypothetical protein
MINSLGEKSKLKIFGDEEYVVLQCSGDCAIVNGKQTTVKIKLNRKPQINSALIPILLFV